MQILIIFLLFALAAFYLGRVIYRSFKSNTCETGCGKCGATIDVNKIAKEIRKNETVSA